MHVKLGLVFSGSPKLHPLVFSVFYVSFLLLPLPAAYTNSVRVIFCSRNNGARDRRLRGKNIANTYDKNSPKNKYSDILSVEEDRILKAFSPVLLCVVRTDEVNTCAVDIHKSTKCLHNLT